MTDNTASGILSRLLGDIPIEYDKSDGSVIKDIMTAVSVELEGAYADRELIADRFYISTATGKDLDNKMDEFGFPRIRATYSAGEVTVAGTAGAQIKTGDRVSDGNISFEFTADGIIDESGEITLPVQACTAGKVGNVLAGSITKFPLTLPNIISVSNSEPTTGGVDEESDAAYRDRFYEYMNTPNTSGNKAAYETWAKEASTSVIKAMCIPLPDGANTVKVVIWSDTGVAGDELLDTVRAYIDEKKMIGANVSVVSATGVGIDIQCQVVFENPETAEAVKMSIQSNVKAYLDRANPIVVNKVLAVIINTEGVSDCTDLTINGGTENITIGETEVAVPEEITYV